MQQQSAKNLNGSWQKNIAAAYLKFGVRSLSISHMCADGTTSDFSEAMGYTTGLFTVHCLHLSMLWITTCIHFYVNTVVGLYFNHIIIIFTARSSYAGAVLGSSFCPSVRLSVCLSVRLSVTRVLCDETKEHRAEIFTSQQRLITMSPFTWNLRLNWPTSLWKMPTSTNICSWRLNRKS